jgi:methylglutaconyl-CoA hydratase
VGEANGCLSPLGRVSVCAADCEARKGSVGAQRKPTAEQGALFLGYFFWACKKKSLAQQGETCNQNLARQRTEHITMSNLLTKIDDNGIATLSLNKPEKHNCFDDTLILEITEALNTLASNKAVRVLILMGEGKSFSAGGDLSWMQRMANYTHEENEKDAGQLAEMLRVLNEFPKPTIARVQGAAFGGAVGLVSCCDMAIGAERASFSLSEVKIGLIPATISPYVIQAIGVRASRRYFQTGERFNAEAALKLGLLSEVVSEEELDSTINDLVDVLLANSPQALTQAKQLILDYANREITPDLIKDSCTRIADIRVSAEGQEGLKAFLEKRSPNWVKQGPNHV